MTVFSMSSPIPAPARKLMDYIATHESKSGPAGYLTIYGHNEDKLDKPITTMTIRQVIAAQGPKSKAGTWARRFGSSAAGRYQFMRDTLLDLTKNNPGLIDQLFSPAVQDQMAMILLERRGYDAYMAGRITVVEFGKRLAMEWASLPVLATTQGAHRQVARGQSYYMGDKQNKSLYDPSEVETVLRSLRKVKDEPAPQTVILERPEVANQETVITKPKSGFQTFLDLVQGKPPLPPATVLDAITDPVKKVQDTLKKLGYDIGNVDGIKGKRTNDAITLARLHNGLPVSNEIDADFLAAMATFPPRGESLERASADKQEVKQAAPDLMSQFAQLRGVAGALLGLGGAGAAGATGVIDSAKNAADSVKATGDSIQEVAASVMLIISYVLGFVKWSISHWWVYVLAAALWMLVKIGWAVFKLVLLYRAGRLQP